MHLLKTYFMQNLLQTYFRQKEYNIHISTENLYDPPNERYGESTLNHDFALFNRPIMNMHDLF